MNTFSISVLLASFLATMITGAPTTITGLRVNPLASLPKLTLDGETGFLNLDSDGVYRAYATNGTVVSAARLTKDEINTVLEARAPALSTAEADAERAAFANVDSSAVPDEELLSPPAAVVPSEQLAKFSSNVSPRSLSPLVEAAQKRQTQPIVCVSSAYCVNDAHICIYYPGCVCNAVICTGI